jgi:TolB-like protein/Tfp pilus assembly protein PilF
MVLPRFLTELKRRKVYRAALVYAGVGWVLLEFADVAFPRLGLPDWTVNFVLALILLGFPLAIVFAWIFDFSPQGIVRTEPLSPAGRHHSLTIAAVVEFVLIVALVVAVGGLYVDRLSLQERLTEAESALQGNPDIGQPEISHPEQYRAIAVLPFADMSEAGDQAWFAEGIAEELLIALSQVKPLSVKARTSSFAFKGTVKTVAEIAEILGVQAVLEGSVRRAKDRVRVTAQLVDAHSGFRIWSGSYERQITDIFQLQDELAKSVVEALRIELRVDPSAPLVSEQTRIPEAYNWFMRGRSLNDWANPHSALRSIKYFEKAVEADPGYAMAWGYLSFARNTMMLFRPFDVAGPPTIAAMEHALALDPEQSEALAVKAMMTQLSDHDWETAGRLYQRAIASRESPWAVANYALFYLQFIDQQRQAIELYANAEKLDPLHAGIKANFAGIFFFAGDDDGAIRKAREALQLDSEHVLAIQFLIAAYTNTNDTVALASLLDDIPPAMQELADIKALVARSYAVRGDEAKARKIYNDLLASFDSLSPNAMFDTALLAISLGEVDQSIELMERLEKSGSWMQFWNKLLPMENGTIRENPRYQALLKRMGLDDASVRALDERMSFE